MLKRLCLSAAICGLAISPLASADADLARDWSAAAGQLYGETVDLLEAEAIPVRFENDVARFSLSATRLARWVEAEGGPQDLSCIFRGMAEEAEVQLATLDTNTRPHSALMRLAVLFHDAEGIALAAITATEHENGAALPAEAKSCAANPDAVRQYLTEQP